MSQEESTLPSLNENSSRRTFLKAGALTSTGLAVGVPGAITPAVANDEQVTSADDQPLNLADITYLQLLAYHHRGAIELARLVPDRTDHQELADFAEMVIEAQLEGIERIKTILSDAGIEPGPVLDVDLDEIRGFISSIPGNPEPNELAYLGALEGQEFDLQFINVFSNHHRGAIQLSQSVLQEGESERVAEMAKEVIQTQQEEIIQMYEWYLDWV